MKEGVRVMAASSIEWTDVTDNVFVVAGDDGRPDGWYCQKVSPGCQHCYAERINGNSFFNGNGLAYRVMEDVPKLMMRLDVMFKWARMRKPKKHFVNSMTDTFADFYPKEWIYELFDAMAAAPLQTFQVLTKRTERMYDVVTRWLLARNLHHVPTNIWLGFSAENQEWFDKRAPWAIMTPALTFVSAEPLLGGIDLDLNGMNYGIDYPEWSQRLDWVIVGGESGPNARPMHPDWVQNIRDKCVKAGVPFFFKQWGEWGPSDLDQNYYKKSSRPVLYDINSNRVGDFGYQVFRHGKKEAGRLLDGKEWNQFPEVHHED